jgi:hypothetical protein
LSAHDGHSTPVLTWHRAADEPAGLWGRISDLGWLPESARVVLQIGPRDRSPLVVATAASLARFLRERQPQARIELLDPASRYAQWTAEGVASIGDGEAIRVSGIATTELAIPRLWFEGFTLITVAHCVPCPRTRLAGILDAQAEPLRRLRNRHDDAVLAYEAHRLAPSDLVVACGTKRWGDRTSDRWWVVGPSDAGVECTVAAAAGVSPARLPLLRALARHERTPAVEPLGESLPVLDGYLASAWRVSANTARAHVARTARGAVRDAIVVRRNLGKIPGFVRRKLASRARGAA